VVSDLFDVLMLNRYYGWYVYTGDLVTAERMLEAELREWAQRGKPIVMTEYGADTQTGLHSMTDEPWSEEFRSICWRCTTASLTGSRQSSTSTSPKWTPLSRRTRSPTPESSSRTSRRSWKW
jgi:beta-galactosidase/beta-glucuronidase